MHRYLILALLMLAPALYCSGESNEIEQHKDVLRAEVLFKGIESLSTSLLPLFRSLASVILIGSLIGRLRDARDGSQVMLAFSYAVIAGAFVVNAGRAAGWAKDLGEATAKEVSAQLKVNEETERYFQFIEDGSTGREVGAAVVTGMLSLVADTNLIYTAFSRPFELDQSAAQAPGESAEEERPEGSSGWIPGPVYWTMNVLSPGSGVAARRTLDAVSDGISGATELFLDSVLSVERFVKLMFLMVVIALAQVFLWLGAVVIGVFDAIRYFLLHTGVVLLPLMIAALSSASLRSQGMNYVTGYLAICLWPLGWALGHLGTVAIFQVLANLCDKSLFARPAGDVVRQITSIHSIGLPDVFVILLFSLLLFIWISLVTFTAPFVITKSIASGQAFFSPMVAGAVQGVAKLAGSAASMGVAQGMLTAAGAAGSGISGASAAPAGLAPVAGADLGGSASKTTPVASTSSASTDSVGAGEGPSGGSDGSSAATMAAFAAARTLMKASSQFDGSPTNAVQSLDSGYSEMLGFRSKAADIAHNERHKRQAR